MVISGAESSRRGATGTSSGSGARAKDAGEAPRTPLSKRMLRDMISLRFQVRRVVTVVVATVAMCWLMWAAFVFEVDMNSRVDESVGAKPGSSEAVALEMSLAELAGASVPQIREDIAQDLGVHPSEPQPPLPPSEPTKLIEKSAVIEDDPNQVYLERTDGVPQIRTSDYPGLNVPRKDVARFHAHGQTMKHRHSGVWVELGKLDMVLLDWYFGYPEVKKEGVFVEFGAMDGLHDSPTRLFEMLLGWKGVLVEPVPRNLERFRAATPRRNNSVLVTKAVCREEENGELVMIGEAGSAAARKYTEPGYESVHRKYWKEPYDQPYTVECAPAKVIMVENMDMLNNGHVDLMTIHVSSSEPVVIDTLDFARVKPKVVVLRPYQTCRGDDGSNACRKKMLKAGYCVDIEIAGVHIYVRNSTDTLGRFGCKPASAS